MIKITITNKPVGKALLYEESMLQGRRSLVPVFRAVARDTNTNEQLIFAVTRSASRLVFDAYENCYGTNGECPPSKPKKPYRACTSQTSKGSFCLRLFEGDAPQQHNIIKGQGSVERLNIMIHKGPGMSEGCLLIAGGKRGHRRFEHWFKNRDTSGIHITVAVLPYS